MNELDIAEDLLETLEVYEARLHTKISHSPPSKVLYLNKLTIEVVEFKHRLETHINEVLSNEKVCS